MSAPEPSGVGRHAEALLSLARASIEYGLRCGRSLAVDPETYPPALRERRASFVTLHRHGDLRGCTGSLLPVLPLVQDVAQTAYRSAFTDPRFPPLTAPERSGLEICISVLGPTEPVPAPTEASLAQRLRPGIDGLILREGSRSSTFLPSVWKSLPSPRDFLAELKRKAGLPPEYWSSTIRFERYRVEEIV